MLCQMEEPLLSSFDNDDGDDDDDDVELETPASRTFNFRLSTGTGIGTTFDKCTKCSAESQPVPILA